MTKDELNKKIEDAERAGEFDRIVVPPNYKVVLPIDGSYNHIKRGPFAWFSRFLAHLGGFIINTFYCNLKIKGKKNLKGIQNAVVICNHINNFDSCMVRQAVFGRKLYITVAPFNSKKGAFGFLLRNAGCMPFSENFDAMKNLNKSVNALLHKKNHFVLFYPEKTCWTNYKKPRPFHNGAFHFALKNNVPVVPVFLTLKGKSNKHQRFTAHIMPALYPDAKGHIKEQEENFKNTAFALYKQKYEEVYGEKLTYLS